MSIASCGDFMAEKIRCATY